jgi:transketolase
MGMTTFGQSAPFKDVETEFGFTVDNVVEVARQVAERATANPTT